MSNDHVWSQCLITLPTVPNDIIFWPSEIVACQLLFLLMWCQRCWCKPAMLLEKNSNVFCCYDHKHVEKIIRHISACVSQSTRIQSDLTIGVGGGGPLIVVFWTCNPKDSIFISKINSELLQACSWWPAIGQANWSCQIWSICKHSYSPVSAWRTTKHLLDFSWGILHCDCNMHSGLWVPCIGFACAAGCRGLCNIKI